MERVYEYDRRMMLQLKGGVFSVPIHSMTPAVQSATHLTGRQKSLKTKAEESSADGERMRRDGGWEEPREPQRSIVDFTLGFGGGEGGGGRRLGRRPALVDCESRSCGGW